MPTKEQFLAARPLIAEDDEYREEMDDLNHKKGGTGGDSELVQSIAQAFRQGVERGSGVVRDVAASLECARRLADKGVDAGKVLELAVQATIDNRKNRKDPPMTLDQVAKWGGLE
jgi:hypothetical protein